MKQTKLILFDFDGTIADTMDAGIEITNRLAEKLNLNKLDLNKIEYYKTLTPKQFLREMKVPLFKIPALAKIYHQEFNKVIANLNPFEGIEYVIQELSKHYKLGILSSNSVENIKIFLKRHKLYDFFEFIYSQPNLFGKSANIKKIMRQHKLKKSQIIYVGDEVRDIEAAHKAHIPVIAVSWGLNSRELLQKNKPDFLAEKPQDILNFLISQNTLNQ